jgi:predicted O-methyltransferase YrrM
MNIFRIKQFFAYVGYKLQRPHNIGHGIHSPFLFSFVTNILYSDRDTEKKIKKVDRIKKQLRRDKKSIEIEDPGAGSVRLQGRKRKICDIAKISSTSPKYGILWHRIVNYYQPEIVIELGTCLGLGTMYLACGNENAKIFTVEDSAPLIQLARQNFQNLNFTNIFIQQGNFDNVLPVLLKENGKFDLLYIDGNHRKEAVLRYFFTSLPFARANSIIIVDDIRWSEEMYSAWLKLCENENVRLSLDLFKVGIIFFNPKLKKQHYKLYY